VELPWRLLGELGRRGVLEEATRTSVRWTVGLLTSRRVADTASVIVVQNPATAHRIGVRAKTSILPNAIAVDVGEIPSAGPRTRDIAFTGRLVPWKGPRLAVRTMRYVSTPGAILRIYGDGDERESILKASQRWGVADHVSFEGQLPRRQLLTRIARAGVVLHPALHDESPIAVAEALTLGTPLVCLDHGGPAELVRQWHRAHRSRSPQQGPTLPPEPWLPPSIASLPNRRQFRPRPVRRGTVSRTASWTHTNRPQQPDSQQHRAIMPDAGDIGHRAVRRPERGPGPPRWLMDTRMERAPSPPSGQPCRPRGLIRKPHSLAGGPMLAAHKLDPASNPTSHPTH
jgi:hypothetical protein